MYISIYICADTCVYRYLHIHYVHVLIHVFVGAYTFIIYTYTFMHTEYIQSVLTLSSCSCIAGPSSSASSAGPRRRTPHELRSMPYSGSHQVSKSPQYTYIYIYGHAFGVSSPPPMVWSEGGGAGGGQERAGLRGLLGPSLHPNLDTKTYRTQRPGLKH